MLFWLYWTLPVQCWHFCRVRWNIFPDEWNYLDITLPEKMISFIIQNLSNYWYSEKIGLCLTTLTNCYNWLIWLICIKLSAKLSDPFMVQITIDTYALLEIHPTLAAHSNIHDCFWALILNSIYRNCNFYISIIKLLVERSG